MQACNRAAWRVREEDLKSSRPARQPRENASKFKEVKGRAGRWGGSVA